MKWVPKRKKTLQMNSESDTQLRPDHSSRQSSQFDQRVWKLLLGMSIWIVLLMGYFVSPLTAVSSVRVEGATQMSSQGLIEQSGITTNQTIFHVIGTKDKIATLMKSQNPHINDVQLYVTGINGILMIIDENPSIASYQDGEDTYELMANGKEMIVTQRFQDVPKLMQFTAELRGKLAEQFKSVSTDILSLIREIRYENSTSNPNAITLFMDDGMTIKADITSIGDKIGYYPKIKETLGSAVGTLDMEVGIYFTPN